MPQIYGLYYEEINRFGNCNREILCVGSKLELKILLNKFMKEMDPNGTDTEHKLMWDDDKNGFSGIIDGIIDFAYCIEELPSAEEFSKEYDERKEDK